MNLASALPRWFKTGLKSLFRASIRHSKFQRRPSFSPLSRPPDSEQRPGATQPAPFKSNFLAVVIGMVAVFLLQACAVTPTVIPGVAIAQNHTATVYILGHDMELIAFDEVLINPPLAGGFSGRKFTVPTGKHKIMVRRNWSGNYREANGHRASPTTSTLVFDAKQDHSYRIQYDVMEHGLNALTVVTVPHIVDINTGARVSTAVD
jgi:hypothetical protein